MSKVTSVRLKRVFRFDPGPRWLRLFRVMWNVGTVGDGKGFSNKLSLAVSLRHAFGFSREWHEWAITFFFLRLHYKRNYGGIYV